MNLSDNGARLIEEFEGFRSCPYRDAVGVWTIGYGSTRNVTPSTPCVSKQEAHDRLKREVTQSYGKAINDLGIPFNQNQFDALTSFVYNVGPGGVAPSTNVGSALRRRDFNAAANGLLAWDHAGGRQLAGLTRRRQAERNLFNTGTGPVVKAHGKVPQLNYVIGPQQNTRVPAVRVLQQQLKTHGHPRINPDGVYGPQTQEVVKQFQRLHNLQPDGVVGPNTWNKVFEQ